MDGGRVLHSDDTKALFANPRSMAAALLTGCKNIASAKKMDTHLVEVPEWGLCLHTQQPVDDGLCAVALRAHYFHPKAAKNRCAVEYLGEMEEPFEWVVQFRYAQQSPESAPLWWRVPKDRRPQNFPPELGIAPENVLLLYA
jgi:molybdate transport system ATP-binding protein